MGSFTIDGMYTPWGPEPARCDGTYCICNNEVPSNGREGPGTSITLAFAGVCTRRGMTETLLATSWETPTHARSLLQCCISVFTLKTMGMGGRWAHLCHCCTGRSWNTRSDSDVCSFDCKLHVRARMPTTRHRNLINNASTTTSKGRGTSLG